MDQIAELREDALHLKQRALIYARHLQGPQYDCYFIRFAVPDSPADAATRLPAGKGSQDAA